jgi:two-component system, sensor histidine kinase and response regulator
MNKKIVLITFFIFMIIAVPLGIQYLKNIKTDELKESTYLTLIKQSEVALKTLIKEKQNTTAMIALGLSRNPDMLKSLEDQKYPMLDLAQYSLELRKKTTFKNVWFQLISKDGISLQRSWTDYKGDKIIEKRKDLQEFFKNPKMTNTISIGKFDLTFKTISPIFDKKKNFLGIIEVITHFNSIARKLEQNNIRSIILADKSYKKQITKPFTKTFIQDYYLAIKGVAPDLLKYFDTISMEQYIQNLSEKSFYIDTNLNSLVSYYHINDIENKPMGHFLFFHSLDSINTSKITESTYFYNIIMVFSIVVLSLIFYFNYTFKEDESKQKNLNAKLLLLSSFIFIAFSLVIYSIIKYKYNQDVFQYKQSIKSQTLLEYDSILNNNNNIAKLIFSRELNTPYIKTLIKTQKRKTLYKYLEKSYKELKQQYNVRQLHFHLKDSTSFLRMHRPNKYGDNLSGIRQSVDFVNMEKRAFVGFEEGRIYNGFRHVFPLELDGEHIGSVEISFDIYSFIDNYINSFKVKRVNFLISKDVIDEKVFKSEQNNYEKSPIQGFYFDKLVIKKLFDVNKPILPNEKDKKILDYISQNIPKGQPFTTYFTNINEITVIIPLINRINNKVIGSIHVSKDGSFLQNRNNEFYQLIATVVIILAFIMVFVYREMLTRSKLNIELEKNQMILDSQSSFILITNGKTIKASNRSMLEFFNYETLEEFKSLHKCICEYFEEGEEYIQQQMSDLTWFEYLKKAPKSKRIVKMKDTQNNDCIFYIEFNPKSKINQDDYIVSFIDVTQFKNIEQQLIQSEKMASLGTMIGNIAHQWRQPLSVISTAASGIEVQTRFGKLCEEDLIKFVRNIITNAEFLSDTIDTFRDFIKEDKSVSEQVVQNILDNTLTILTPTLHNNYIKLHNKINYSPQITKLMSKGELAQVITNLINNAKDILLQKKIEKPEITLSCTLQKEIIVITVEDNAGGVPHEIIDKIFEPYFTTKHQSMGTGLGLYMSHKIVAESLHGKLSVSNSKNGAVFTIEIPMDK